MKTVTVNISPQGEVDLEVQGASGPSCLSLTEGIEEALGRMTTREAKPEMHQHDQLGQQQHEDHGH